VRREEEKKRRAEGPSFSTRVAQASDQFSRSTLGSVIAITYTLPYTLQHTTYHLSSTIIMSFLFGGAPKMSSAEKIAAAETEVEMISDMFNR
jgi:hypothetical protein